MAHSDTAPRAAPLYATLADSLQTLIDQGTLKPGHRIPSVRRMAMQRDVSIATVLQAYSVLENRGLLEAPSLGRCGRCMASAARGARTGLGGDGQPGGRDACDRICTPDTDRVRAGRGRDAGPEMNRRSRHMNCRAA